MVHRQWNYCGLRSSSKHLGLTLCYQRSFQQLLDAWQGTDTVLSGFPRCVDAPVPEVARVGRVLERHSNRRSSAITVLTAHKEHVRRLGVDRAISTMGGR